jgi:hypothetical protein
MRTRNGMSLSFIKESLETIIPHGGTSDQLGY